MSSPDVLERFLQDVTPTIETLVTKALQQGRATAELALLLERAFDGAVLGGCESRGDIAAKLGSDPRLTGEQRAALLESIEGAGNDVPAILIVHVGEGEIWVGARRLPGSLSVIS
jgi:hypothetical protein